MNDFRIALTGFAANEVSLRARARKISEAEGRALFEVAAELRTQHLAELKRELAATAPTDPAFERLVGDTEFYELYCSLQRRKHWSE